LFKSILRNFKQKQIYYFNQSPFFEGDFIIKMEKETIINDTKDGMDLAYEELRLKLIPVMHNKIKSVNGKLLKDSFKLIGQILNSHQILVECYYPKSNTTNINKEKSDGS